MQRLGFVLILGIGLSACSTTTKKAELSQASRDLQSICTAGESVQNVRGQVWVKAKALGSNIQFPAHVAVNLQGLELQAVNLLGGQEAVLKIEGNHYSLDIPRDPQRNRQGDGRFSGLPVEWMTKLFLGQPPCPKDFASLSESAIQIDSEGRIVATTQDEIYTFSLLNWAGNAWPSRLEIKNKKTTAWVKFEFETPEDSTRAIKLWQGMSPEGEIKVKWSNRAIN